MNPLKDAEKFRNLLETWEIEYPLDEESDDEEEASEMREENSDTEPKFSDTEGEEFDENQYFVGEDETTKWNKNKPKVSIKKKVS